jgi:hypothetical protein
MSQPLEEFHLHHPTSEHVKFLAYFDLELLVSEANRQEEQIPGEKEREAREFKVSGE